MGRIEAAAYRREPRRARPRHRRRKLQRLRKIPGHSRARRRIRSDRVQGRLEEIELERQAEIQRTGDVYNANARRRAEEARAVSRHGEQANENAKTIFDDAPQHEHKTLKAVGTFGENLRRIVIGAEAARALVRAAVEGAEAIASLAIGRLPRRGAARRRRGAVRRGRGARGARILGGGGAAAAAPDPAAGRREAAVGSPSRRATAGTAARSS
jgi:hypothetical protein